MVISIINKPWQAYKAYKKAKKVAPDITKVAPTVGKELSESARGLRLAGWAKNLSKKLKKD